MTVDEKIASICKGIEGLTYHYNDWTRANVELDRVPLPVLINVLPAAGEFNLKNGQFRDCPECAFAFLDKTDFDADAAENETVIARMKGFARKFIRAVNQSGQFEPVSGAIRYQVVYDRLDVNTTGIIVNIQLREKNGICL